MDDIAPSIISRLPPDALVSLANTTSASITSKADDVWNKKLIAMGYGPVPCAQGFYFCVNKVGDEHEVAIQRMIAGGVVAHLVAYFRKHPDAYKALEWPICYSTLTYDELSPEMVEFLTVQIKKLWEETKALIDEHHIPWIISLSFWDEDSISDEIEDDANIARPVDLSIVPVALHYGVWPSQGVWEHYLPQILLQYPGFFQTGKMTDPTGWIDYDSNTFHNLEDIKDELEAKALQDYDEYGKAYLYLLYMTNNRTDANSYIADFAKEIVMENPTDMIHLVGYHYDEKIFTTLLAAIRRYDVFKKWIIPIIRGEIFFHQAEDQVIVNFFDLPQNKLTKREMEYVRSHKEEFIHPGVREMLGI